VKRVALTFGRNNVEPYAAALREVGLEPVLISPDHPIDTLEGFHGLLLSGGADVDPAFYGQPPLGARNTYPERDALESTLIHQACERNLPLLAICRGLQLFNICHPGGTLLQHIEGHEVRTPETPWRTAHSVAIEPHTRLADILQVRTLEVNSRHHQAVDQIGRGLRVAARAYDIVEALERPDLRFAVAVQWHPEDQITHAPEQRRLWEAFAQAL
jgi:putative glutamine amidotransferase